MSKNLKPVLNDDEGNLLKSGYKSEEMELAKKHFRETVKENPEMSELTFSQYIYQLAALNIVFDEKILPKVRGEK